MADIYTQLAHTTGDALWAMNNHINENGEIQRSSPVIKLWHTYTNDDWFRILGCVKHLSNCAGIRLPVKTELDIGILLKHLKQYDEHCDNVLYPKVKVTNSLPKAITNINGDTSVKTVTFRTMMNIRETLCAALDIDLPNADSSIGKLNPTAFEALYEL